MWSESSFVDLTGGRLFDKLSSCVRHRSLVGAAPSKGSVNSKHMINCVFWDLTGDGNFWLTAQLRLSVRVDVFGADGSD